MKEKIIVILGPTATGKSALGVALAQSASRRINGEIVSADSRQIYRGLDIGTGKITKKEMQGVPHHLLDVASPKDTYTVATYKHDAEKVINNILKHKKVPIVVGGSGFYIQAIVDNVMPPQVKPDKTLRQKLQQKTPAELLQMLKTLDPQRAQTIEQKNKRRLIRAIEIAQTLGSVPPKTTNPKYTVLQIGIDMSDEALQQRIYQRVKERLAQGWREEVKKLIQQGLPKERFAEFGLGYSILYATVSENSSVHEDTDDLIDAITQAEWQYAKRQRKWFKRDKNIRWYMPNEEEKISRLMYQFLNSDEATNV